MPSKIKFTCKTLFFSFFVNVILLKSLSSSVFTTSLPEAESLGSFDTFFSFDFALFVLCLGWILSLCVLPRKIKDVFKAQIIFPKKTGQHLLRHSKKISVPFVTKPSAFASASTLYWMHVEKTF